MRLITSKEQLFARHVAAGRTNREAALLAGYSCRSASSLGSQLARRARIVQRVEQLRSELGKDRLDQAIELLLSIRAVSSPLL